MAKRPAADLGEPELAAEKSAKRVSVEKDPEVQTATATFQGEPVAQQSLRTKETSRGRVESDEVDSEASESESESTPAPRRSQPEEGYQDLYLDTIDRRVLDFDFEKVCSVTVSNVNVYSCLVCGKYFQGRGPRSPAYYHALELDHHVWINMRTKQVYVLPEGYEVTSASLDDIKYVVDPIYSAADVAALDAVSKPSWDLDGKPYTPGFVGMNNIKANDYVNVVVHALAHVGPLRDFFLRQPAATARDLTRPQAELVRRLGVLIRKIWNGRAFKSHVSPHELLQAISELSKKRFTLTTQADPADLLVWLANEVHLGLGGSRSRPQSSLVQRTFQGRMRVWTDELSGSGVGAGAGTVERSTTAVVPFLFLPVDLPAAPLFQDEMEKNIIPQVSLGSVLAKYDGVRVEEGERARRRFRLVAPLPEFLVFQIKRFSANKFVEERNRTIVTFSPVGLDMSPFVEREGGAGGGAGGSDRMDTDVSAAECTYDLVANVTHEGVKARDDSVSGEVEQKVWRVQLLDKAAGSSGPGAGTGGLGEWVEVQDLFVAKAAAETLFTGESYIQIWQKRPQRAGK